MRIFIHITSKSEDSSCCSRLAEIVLRTYAHTPPFGLNFWWNSNPGQVRWLLEVEGETCVSVWKRMSGLFTWRKRWTESTFLDSPRMLQNEYVRDFLLERWWWEILDCGFRAEGVPECWFCPSFSSGLQPWHSSSHRDASFAFHLKQPSCLPRIWVSPEV